MKHTLIAVVALMLASPLAFGADTGKYGMAGCGLGSIVMGHDGGQISAATTNGTSYSQVGGITSGTSNCIPDPEGKTTITIGQEQFTGKNLAALSKEMAQGKGDTLVAFSQSLGCEENVFPEFASELQKSYDTVFAAPGAVAVLETAKAQVRSNPVLAQSCKHII